MSFDTLFYGGRLRDKKALSASSSGGAFTALSNVFLERGDAVVCSSYNYESHQQEYRLITSAEERDKARGSKYIQAIPGNVFKKAEEWLKANPGHNLIFFGTGCHAAGFRSYMQAKHLDDRITVVDLICHGTPSPMLWKSYIQKLEKEKGKISYLTFKDKRNGWHRPTPVVQTPQGEVQIRDYVKIFYGENALRESCYACPYASIERNSDITIGDLWHIEDKRPEMYDDTGTSLFIIHSEKGKALFDDAVKIMDHFEVGKDECWQINLERPTARPETRETFWDDYKKRGLKFIISKYGNDSFKTRLVNKLRRVFK